MRSVPNLAGLAVFLLGCRVVSLLPHSGRGESGPVEARGVISREARSQVRLYRDAAGCQSIQTVGRQFRLVTVVGDGGPRRLILEESYDVRRCLESEGASSEALITAWRPDSGANQPLYRITGRGVSGSAMGNLYRMMSRGCCGSEDLGTYFSLLTGRALFSSNLTPVRIELANTSQVRYLAFHDTFSALHPVEAERDSTVIGVLQYGDDRRPARRLLVLADRPEGFATTRLRLIREGRAMEDSVVVLSRPPFGGLRVRVELVAPGSNRRVWLEAPIEGDSLDISHARMAAGVRLRRAR